jgi:hypothetical protein
MNASIETPFNLMVNIVSLENANSSSVTRVHYRQRTTRRRHDCPSELHPRSQAAAKAAQMERSGLPSRAFSAACGQKVVFPEALCWKRSRRGEPMARRDCEPLNPRSGFPGPCFKAGRRGLKPCVLQANVAERNMLTRQSLRNSDMSPVSSGSSATKEPPSPGGAIVANDD